MKVVISGAGIAGLALAHELARRHWEVLVLERSPGLRDSGYVMDFLGPGYDAAKAMGVLGRLEARAVQTKAISFIHEDTRLQGRLDYDLMRRAMKGRVMQIMRGDIERGLFEALPPGVDVRYGVTLTGIDSRADGVTVQLSDGTSAAADLLVGADGLHSAVRRELFGPEDRFLRFLGYHTAAFLFDDPAVQRALGDEGFTMLSVPGREVAFYRTHDRRLASFFVFRCNERERPVDPAAKLREAFGDLGWVVPQALDAAERCSDIFYDVLGQIELDSLHRGRVVLLGDAAYAVSLLAGQGASLAIAGAFMLAEDLANGPVDAALDRFESRMVPMARKDQAAGRRTAHWLVPPSRFHIWVRSLVFRALGTTLLAKVIAPARLVPR